MENHTALRIRHDFCLERSDYVDLYNKHFVSGSIDTSGSEGEAKGETVRPDLGADRRKRVSAPR